MATEVIQKWTFGEPTLEAGGEGRASWVKADDTTIPDRDQAIVWLAQLDAGAQSSYDDFAKVVVPVNELTFSMLKTVRLEPYYSADVGIDMGVCVYLHDPNDFDQYIQLSHTPLTTSAAGWRELYWPDDIPIGHAYFWYGNVTDTPDLCPEEGDPYTLAEFRADAVFGKWTIYKISFDYGYYTGGDVMNGCYLAQAQINGKTIQLYPDVERWLKSVNTQKLLLAATQYSAGDVMSEATSDGTAWEFAFGGAGRIVKAIAVSATNALTAAIKLYLYSATPTCELDDHAANTGPIVDDLPYYIGHIVFPALASQGAGSSYTTAIAFESGVKLPLAFDSQTLYGVAVDGSGQDFAGPSTLDITLTAEIEL